MRILTIGVISSAFPFSMASVSRYSLVIISCRMLSGWPSIMVRLPVCVLVGTELRFQILQLGRPGRWAEGAKDEGAESISDS